MLMQPFHMSRSFHTAMQHLHIAVDRIRNSLHQSSLHFKERLVSLNNISLIHVLRTRFTEKVFLSKANSMKLTYMSMQAIDGGSVFKIFQCLNATNHILILHCAICLYVPGTWDAGATGQRGQLPPCLCCTGAARRQRSALL